MVVIMPACSGQGNAMECSRGALGGREGWCGVERSGGSERRRLGRGCFYRPARSDDGAWAVASANRRARADIRGHWKVT
jgi:hypothetical protein